MIPRKNIDGKAALLVLAPLLIFVSVSVDVVFPNPPKGVGAFDDIGGKVEDELGVFFIVVAAAAAPPNSVGSLADIGARCPSSQ